MMKAKDITVGIIANPASGRDMRRLLGWPSISTSSEKVNTALRFIAALGSRGVGRVLLMPDDSGMAKRIKDTVGMAWDRKPDLPEVSLLAMTIEGNRADSTEAASLLQQQGAQMIAVLGGDGTHRAVAKAETGLPLAAMSTGTNNAFPGREDATATGLAAALYLTGQVPDEIALASNKRLLLNAPDWREMALVDICFSRQTTIGGRAVWRENDIAEVWVSFAEPWSIGLASLAGLVTPVGRSQSRGVRVRMGGSRQLTAMIMPGMVSSVQIKDSQTFELGVAQNLAPFKGTIAFDGEREREVQGEWPMTLTLDWGGPRTLRVKPTLAQAAAQGILLS